MLLECIKTVFTYEIELLQGFRLLFRLFLLMHMNCLAGIENTKSSLNYFINFPSLIYKYGAILEYNANNFFNTHTERLHFIC